VARVLINCSRAVDSQKYMHTENTFMVHLHLQRLSLKERRVYVQPANPIAEPSLDIFWFFLSPQTTRSLYLSSCYKKLEPANESPDFEKELLSLNLHLSVI
jgi:hypothetical protein